MMIAFCEVSQTNVDSHCGIQFTRHFRIMEFVLVETTQFVGSNV